MKVRMNFSVNPLEKSGILTFEESLTIQYIAEIKALLEDAISQVDSVFLDFENVKEIDVAGLQVMYSACETARSLNKVIKNKSNLPPLIQQILEQTGFNFWLRF